MVTPVTSPAGPAAEIRVLQAVQQLAGGAAPVSAARALSRFGEHASGWLALGALGAAIDRHRCREWVLATGAVATAHATSIAVKRVVRRHRPDHPDVAVLATTPSRLSFPSAHASSTTTAALLFGALLRRPLALLLVPPMLAARLVLGVHYPSDVLAGTVLGGLVALAARRVGIRSAS